MTGDPPYSNLAPLSAMFRIVQDDHPPIPDGVSETLEDFMLLCFQRDPKLRNTAAKLYKHKWVQSALKTSRQTEEAVDHDKQIKQVKDWNEALDSSMKISKAALQRAGSTDKGSLFDSIKINSIRFHKAPQQSATSAGVAAAQNAATTAAGGASGAGKDERGPLKIAETPAKPGKPEVAQLKKSMTAPMFDSTSLSNTQFQKRFAEKEEEDENWDEDFAGDLVIGGNEGNTIVPEKPKRMPSINDGSTVKATAPAVPPKPTLAALGGEHPKSGDAAAAGGLFAGNLKLHVETSSSTQSSGRFDSSYSENSSFASTKAVSLGADSEGEEDWSEFSEDITRKNLTLLPGKNQWSGSRPGGTVDLNAYAEKDDEDFSDVVMTKAGESKLRKQSTGQEKKSLDRKTLEKKRSLDKMSLERKGSDKKPLAARPPQQGDEPPPTPGTLQDYSEIAGEDDFSDVFEYEKTKGPGKTLDLRVSAGFWSENAKDEEEEDIFADLEDQLDVYDMEQAKDKDKRAKATTEAQKLLALIRVGTADDVVIQTCRDLVQLTRTISEPVQRTQDAKRDLLSHLGHTALITLVDFCNTEPSPDVLCTVLHLINEMTKEDHTVQEGLGWIGAIPAISKFASNKYDFKVRCETALFISICCHSGKKALQLLVSSRSLGYVVDLLDEDYFACPDLVWVGIDCIWNLYKVASVSFSLPFFIIIIFSFLCFFWSHALLF